MDRRTVATRKIHCRMSIDQRLRGLASFRSAAETQFHNVVTHAWRTIPRNAAEEKMKFSFLRMLMIAAVGLFWAPPPGGAHKRGSDRAARTREEAAKRPPG